MKMTIDIPEEEINQTVQTLFVRRMAEQLFNERDSYDQRSYRRMLKEAVKEALADHIDEVVDRAVVYAADYIGKKGVKKFLEKLGEGVKG